eukprot:7059332-Pyramimonas_sp.AAC.1
MFYPPPHHMFSHRPYHVSRRGADDNIRLPTQVLKLTMPIIAFTAEYSPEMQETCKGVGMNDFLSKPANAKEFREKIRKQLALVQTSKCIQATQLS